MGGPRPNRLVLRSSFETATHALVLSQEGFEGDALPRELKRRFHIEISKKQAQNYVRARQKLAPEIQRAWQMGDAKAKTTFLFKLAARPHAMQLRLWNDTKPR